MNTRHHIVDGLSGTLLQFFECRIGEFFTIGFKVPLNPPDSYTVFTLLACIGDRIHISDMSEE